MIAVQILLYVLLFILLILLMILLLPVYYASSGRKDDIAFLKAEVFGPLRWFYFIFEMQDIKRKEIHLSIFGIRVNIQGKKSHSQGKGKEKKEEEKNKKIKKKKKKKSQKGLIGKVLKVVEGFWKHTRPRHLDVEGRYGFEDPYHTGLVCAVINCAAPHGDKYNINLVPVFDEEVMEGSFVMEGRIVPAVLLWIFLRVFVIPELKARLPLINKCRA